jgi:hypothetical protein
VARELGERLIGNFTKGHTGERKINGWYDLFNKEDHFKDLILFYEYFHGDNGRGIGASHQTGWTGLITEVIRKESM